MNSNGHGQLEQSLNKRGLFGDNSSWTKQQIATSMAGSSSDREQQVKEQRRVWLREEAGAGSSHESRRSLTFSLVPKKDDEAAEAAMKQQ